MKLRTFLITLALVCLSPFALANGIDDNCHTLTYKTAPVVSADLYICHKEYAVAYSFKSKNPIYTTEYLVASHIGKAKRTNDFRVDPAVPKQYQSKPKDYVHAKCNDGRCDRGHMTPDQDFSATHETTSESFFMTNMVPQNYKNNEVIWKAMEVMIRKYVATHPEGVYVISGPVYKSATPSSTIGADKVWVPDYLFKVVIDAKTGKSIAFYMPNNPESNLSQFVVSLSTVEAATGIKFDASLDKTTKGNFADW